VKAAVLTVSDGVDMGTREDASGDLRLRRDLRRLGRASPDNVFVIKATWWLNP